MKYHRGLLPLSGDPITYGHLDIIQRAGKRCDELIVALLDNPGKANTYVFKVPERLKNLERAIAENCHDLNVTVMHSEDSTVDVFLTQGCDVLFRGARDKNDLEYEKQQLYYYDLIVPGMSDKTVILDANPRWKHVQSTVVRNFAQAHLDATAMIPMFIQARLWRHLHGQKVVGITGLPGVGKTTLIQAALPQIRADGMKAHHVDMNTVIKAMLEQNNQGIKELKEKLAANGDRPMAPDLRELFLQHLSRAYRQEITGRSGIVLVEYSYLLEDAMAHWVNNNVIVITSRDFLPAPDSERHTAPHWTADEKLAAAQRVADHDNYGMVLAFPNNRDASIVLDGIGPLLIAKARGGGI